MNDLNITSTQSTPSVVADGSRGVLEMHGDSYPENSFEFFVPIIQWVEEFLQKSTPDKPLTLELYLLYLNTSSVKAMMDIFDFLEDAYKNDKAVAVRWYYDVENDRIAELAEEFKEDCTFPFDIVPKSS